MRVFELIHKGLYDERISELFTLEGLRSLFAMICLNAQGLGTSSYESYQRFLRQVEIHDTDLKENLLCQVESYESRIEEVSGSFTHVEGSGLWVHHKFLNHSCDPNAEIQFPYGDGQLEGKPDFV